MSVLLLFPHEHFLNFSLIFYLVTVVALSRAFSDFQELFLVSSSFSDPMKAALQIGMARAEGVEFSAK